MLFNKHFIEKITQKMSIVTVTPSSLAFVTSLDEIPPSPPPSQTVDITNTGTGTLSWTATSMAPWLVVSPTSGTAPSTVTVSVITTSLGEIKLSSNILVKAVGSTSTATIAVTLVVNGEQENDFFCNQNENTNHNCQRECHKSCHKSCHNSCHKKKKKHKKRKCK
jgi:hypothetical protein